MEESLRKDFSVTSNSKSSNCTSCEIDSRVWKNFWSKPIGCPTKIIPDVIEGGSINHDLKFLTRKQILFTYHCRKLHLAIWVQTIKTIQNLLRFRYTSARHRQQLTKSKFVIDFNSVHRLWTENLFDRVLWLWAKNHDFEWDDDSRRL
jgi:hypothetical protein